MRAALVLLVVAGWLIPAVAAAQEPESGSVSAPPANVRVGEPFTLILQLVVPDGVAVEVDTASPGWGDLEVVEARQVTAEPESAGAVRHVFEVQAVATRPGRVEFVPAVFLIDEGLYTHRELEGGVAEVVSVLSPGDPLELSPIGVPGPVDGAQSPWLVPMVALAGVVLAVLVVSGVAWLVRWWMRRPRGRPTLPEFEPEPALDIDTLVRGAGSDAVALYRAMATLVRGALAVRYGFPARALTTAELQRRMDAVGVDRWQSRLVSGLLEQCDAVVYAGYRPARERQEADIEVAREVLQGAG